MIMIHLDVRREHQRLAVEHLGPGFWDRVEEIYRAPAPEVEEFPAGICRADDCDLPVMRTGKRVQPPAYCSPEHEKPAKAAEFALIIDKLDRLIAIVAEQKSGERS
jgi:hypothetical protein